MGWFSPVKGSYPSLAQVDKTLPVKAGTVAIERGTIVALKPDANSAGGVWDVAGSSDKILYVALQDYSDPTAGFAGTAFDPKGGEPSITAIDLAQDGEYETSVFDTTQTYAAGDGLKVVDGKLTKAAGADAVVGYVTAPAFSRWINNAIAVPDQKNGATDRRLAIRTGARMTVLRFKTAL